MKTGNNAVFIIGGALLISMILLVGISFVVQKPKEEKADVITKTVPPPTGSFISSRADTILKASFSRGEVLAEEAFTIEIAIATGDNLVTGVQLEMYYDPKVLAITSINTGDFFASPIEYINKIDEKRGDIIYAIGSFDGKKGSGILAKLSVKAIAKTNGRVEVLTIKPTTLIAEFDNTQSVLKDMEGVSLVIR